MLGEYPAYKLIQYKNEGITLPIQDGDLETLKAGTCDFLSFSLYGSHTVTVHKEGLKKGEGLNCATGEYGDLIAMGVSDPVKVTRTALESAASVAALILITEATINEIPKDPDPAAAAAAAAAACSLAPPGRKPEIFSDSSSVLPP